VERGLVALTRKGAWIPGNYKKEERYTKGVMRISCVGLMGRTSTPFRRKAMCRQEESHHRKESWESASVIS
jgi:hypothetical protein